MTANGAELLVKQLVDHGVDRVYSLNGGHIAPIYDACLDVDIEIIDVRHEDAAVHMAHAYARLTGRPGVACLTAGPGVTNGISAMAAAWSAASPVVVIAGKVPIPQIDKGALQDVDQIALVGAVSKTARSVRTTDQIREAVSEAFSVAAEPVQGPTFLEIPIDVLRSDADSSIDTAKATVDPKTPPDGSRLPMHAIAAAVELLTSAERPVLIAGSGVLWSNAENSVRTLAERLGMPVVTTSLARGILPIDHPLNLYAARSRVLDAADVLLIVGTRFNYILNYGRPPRISSTAKVIRIDASPSEIVRNRTSDV
ncbi:MAG TPA: thiamine pyrophosphate-binding protein, partial [Acidimicrobiia bacterium]|nr:thiamine pyrophosphate-binding protein [Acidimicrobiia bacterium]